MAAGVVFIILCLMHKLSPLVPSLTYWFKRLRGTTEFMTEEAVKPIVTAAGQIANLRALARAVTGQDRKRRG